MQLSSLLQAVIPVPAAADRDVRRLVIDSRQVIAGDAFIALPGTQVDGRQFIETAIVKGAVSVLVEGELGEKVRIVNGVSILPVPDLRQCLGEIASAFYGHPSRFMKMIGVTGTNGKTSCTHFIAQCLRRLRLKCGVIGTLGNGVDSSLSEPGLTTPDAVSLQAVLRSFVDQGAVVTAMEVSSHSIDQGRVNGIAFESVIFTNLTQDHLDYHGSMEVYAGVKKRFITTFPAKHAIVNADDVCGREMLNELDSHPSVFAYGLAPRDDLPPTIPYIYVDQVQLELEGIKAHVYTPWGDGRLRLPLIGQFNLSNVLAVLTVLCAYEVPFATVLELLSNLEAVPGRMQLLGGKQQPLVVVDYSHTPDSLEKALRALKLHAKGKLICVFGCGGDRDAGKRPEMARVAEKLADRVIITNDNPRHEDPEAIASQIIAGLNKPNAVDVLLDRSKAIEKSIQWATANDCILIAGKGAERYQLIGDTKHPFDDVAQVSRYLNLES